MRRIKPSKPEPKASVVAVFFRGRQESSFLLDTPNNRKTLQGLIDLWGRGQITAEKVKRI